ncbi:MAG: hypothetical protein ACTSRU_13450 [Candidatus Hodarchaeales archaeon]
MKNSVMLTNKYFVMVEMRDYGQGSSNNSDALMFGDGQRFEVAQSGTSNIRRKLEQKRLPSQHPREKTLQLSRVITPGIILTAGLIMVFSSLFTIVKLVLFYDPELHSQFQIVYSFGYLILGIVFLFGFYKFWVAPEHILNIRSWIARKSN